MCDNRIILRGERTRHLGIGLVFLLLPLSISPAAAQNVPTTVQLPTLSSFSVQTSVSVPDSGGAYKDALRRRQFGQTMPYSPLNPRLRNPVGRSAAGGSQAATQAQTPRDAAADYAEAARNQAAHSPAAALRVKQREAKQREEAIRKALADGRAAAARGRLATARVYFTYAERRATGSLKELALAELKLLDAQELDRQSATASR